MYSYYKTYRVCIIIFCPLKNASHFFALKSNKILGRFLMVVSRAKCHGQCCYKKVDVCFSKFGPNFDNLKNNCFVKGVSFSFNNVIGATQVRI
jgi:hypothetical protein